MIKNRPLLPLWRIFFVSALFSLFFLIIVLRLFYLQVLSHDRFEVLASQQHFFGRQIEAVRGEIKSSNGHPLASNKIAYLVFAIPKEVKDAEETAKQLVDIFGLNLSEEEREDEKLVEEKKGEEVEQIKKLLERDLYWIAIKKRVDEEKVEQIKKLKLEGIYFEESQKRFYPEGTLAAHVLGFVGSDNQGRDKGYYGVEGYFDGDLKGIPGAVMWEKDASGKPIPVGSFITLEPSEGRDLILTLNREIQYLVEKKLKEGVQRYKAKDGTVVILKPQTGEILAMANYPTYDPSNWQDKEVREKELYKNRAVADVYEPGSVFKTLLMSAALESKTVKPDTKINDEGPLAIQGYLIRTWNNKYHGEESMAEILEHSCNTGAAQVATKLLGLDKYYDFLLKFSLNELLDVGLEEEEIGIIKPKEDWREIDLATAAFGQGISVTPLQLTTILATVANDGRLMKPYIVKQIVGEDRRINFEPQVLLEVVSPKTAKTLGEMLVSVVEHGEFKYFVLKNYRIAGKTGTAQIPVGGRYDPYKTNVTFVGFAPKDDPEFVMLVKLTEPSASTFSADTAVPLWMEIAKELFLHFGIAPIR